MTSKLFTHWTRNWKSQGSFPFEINLLLTGWSESQRKTVTEVFRGKGEESFCFVFFNNDYSSFTYSKTFLEGLRVHCIVLGVIKNSKMWFLIYYS